MKKGTWMHLGKKMLMCAAAAAIGLTAAMTAWAAPAAEEPEGPELRARTYGLTIYKFDLTKAQEDGVTQSFVSTGQMNPEVYEAYQGYGIPGVEFSYVQVGEMKTRTYTDPESGQAGIELVYGLSPDKVAALSSIGVTEADAEYEEDGKFYYLSDTLVDGLAGALEADPIGVKDALENYVRNRADKVSGLTDADGVYHADVTDAGLYLVAETAVPEMVVSTVEPFFVLLPMPSVEGDGWHPDVVVYPKNRTGSPSLEKEVAGVTYEEGADGQTEIVGEYSDTLTASGGDVLSYRITSTLPEISTQTTYLTSYVFRDTLSEGVSYRKGDVKLAWYAPDGNLEAEWAGDTDRMQVSYQDGEDGAEVMEVVLTEAGLAAVNLAYSGYTAVLTYQAVLNADDSAVMGDAGNQNQAVLTWRRSNVDSESGEESHSKVYTYGIELVKRFHSGEGDFSQVEFTLGRDEDNTYLTARKEADGVYYVTGAAAYDSAAVFTPAADGTLRIYGLEEGTYFMTEIGTDDGYALLEDEILITISSVEEEGGRVASATVNGVAVDMIEADGSEHALVPLQVVNEKIFELPMTGDNGLFILPLVGLAAGSALLFALLMLRKKGSAAGE